MLTSKRFALAKSTLAIDSVITRGWITIPAGAIIQVVADPSGEGDLMVDIRWEGLQFTIFTSDLTAGGMEMKYQRASA